ncbi:hypothetical protein BCU71_23525 [Vibrio lentus]|uniref:hypothetical protein n=1 Tax=Vibrio lentus TaxID=136468 RepID=UPI000C858DD8|nr:hypothetical protein [Vibrio lentus]PMH26178.1 hypothetical protein BCU71_23525 [Vibrio lentus]PMI89293.1 hypothetical protein BCU35_23275 [Vibrio lentus]PMK64921.1 hypothetical protein BCT93_24855 [Vibrio lentus]
MSEQCRKFFEVTENYSTSEFHFLETDIRTFEIIYDVCTSYANELLILSTGKILEYNLKKVYRYADGFLIDTTIANKISSMDCYNISLIPTVLTDGGFEIKSYYYLKVLSVKSCINLNDSEYYKSGDIISYNKISIFSDEINVKDRIFFIDDEYSILMDEQLMSTFEENDIVFQAVNVT